MNLLGRISPEQESENLQALARRIIDSKDSLGASDSPARFVFLLETNHYTTLYAERLMLDREASSLLWGENFKNFFIEADAGNLDINTTRENKEDNEGEENEKFFLQRQLILKPLTDSPRCYPVGSNSVSAEEIRLAARKELNRGKLLLERLWSIPKAANIKIPGQEPLILLEALISKPEEMILHIINKKSHLPAYRQEIEKAGGFESFVGELAYEIHTMQRLLVHFRLNGKADMASAKKILDISKKNKGRAIINYGSAHGEFANAPMSLPEQLLTQGTNRQISDMTADVIVMMDSDHAANYIHTLTEGIPIYYTDMTLRPSITVWDVNLRQGWPIHEWIQQAPAIYASSFRLPRPQQISILTP